MSGLTGNVIKILPHWRSASSQPPARPGCLL